MDEPHRILRKKKIENGQHSHPPIAATHQRRGGMRTLNRTLKKIGIEHEAALKELKPVAGPPFFGTAHFD